MIKLILGDCLEKMKDIPNNSIDLILCDLPYGVTASSGDSRIPFPGLWFQYKRIRKLKSTILLFNTEPFGSELRLFNVKEYKYDWIWVKNRGSNFFHARNMPIRYTENISVFQKGSGWYYPIKTIGHISTNSGIGRNTGNVYHRKSRVHYKGGDTTRYPKNLLEYKIVNNYSRLHPLQKPVELLEYLIRTYTVEGGLVLDNCMGSGSTGIACLNTNRNFIGIEKDKKYFEIARKRIEKK
jgi:DNA modification methylase